MLSAKPLRGIQIIGINEIFETDSTLYLVLELYVAFENIFLTENSHRVTGGELFHKIVDERRFSEKKSHDYFVQMLNAIKYLHEQGRFPNVHAAVRANCSLGIAHRDLKPENILLKDESEEVIKISDFGLSRTVDEATFMKTMCGTPQYVGTENSHFLTSNPPKSFKLPKF